MANNLIIEIGDFYIRIGDGAMINNQIKVNSFVNLEKNNDFFVTSNYHNLDLLAKDINNLISSQNIKGKTVNLIIPDTYTYSQILTMPFLKEKELLSAIKFQADQFIPLPIDKTTIDIDILYEDKKANQLLILIVAAPNKLIDHCISLIEQANLIPQIIENQTTSFLRLVDVINKNRQEEKLAIIINFDFFSTTLYCYDYNLNSFNSIFNFKTGLEIFLKEVEINLSLDRQNALKLLKSTDLINNQQSDLYRVISPALSDFINNLNRYIISLTEKNPNMKVNQIYTANLTNYFLNFEALIEKQINIPTMILDPLNLIYKNNFYDIIAKNKSSCLSILGGLIE